MMTGRVLLVKEITCGRNRHILIRTQPGRGRKNKILQCREALNSRPAQRNAP